MRVSALPSPLGLRLARLRSAVWRFRALPFAEALFAGVPAGTRLARPFAGATLAVDVGRSSTERLLFLDGERALPERHLLARLLRPGGRALDVGANLGYYALLLARGVGPLGTVECFEPEPDNLATLAANVAGNALSARVRVHPVAVGESSGTVRLAPGLNGVVDAKGALEVPLVRLDDLSGLNGRAAPPVDFLKIDVEGYEAQVLRGAANLLDRDRPALFVEIHPELIAPPDSAAAIVGHLRSLYPRLGLWRPARGGGVLSRLFSRYLPGRAVERIGDVEAFLAACAAGVERAPFWAVAARLGVEER